MWGFTDCRAISGMLWNYSAHRLSEQEVERVEQHLSSCGACRAEAEAFRRTVDALGTLRQSPVPDSRRGWRELEARLSSADTLRISSRSPWAPALAWGTMAAALLFVIVVHPFGAVRTDTATHGGIARITRHPDNAMPSGGSRDVGAGDPYGALGDDIALESALDYGAYSEARASGASEPAVPRHRWHPSIRVAAMESGLHHLRTAGLPLARRHQVARGYKLVDNTGTPPPSGEARDYVLTPVSTTSDADSGAEYVMGSVIMSARSGDTEVANGW